MKKICFLCYDLNRFGGLERAVTSVCNALAGTQKYEIYMASTCKSGENFHFSTHKDIKIHDFNLKPSERFWKISLKITTKLLKYLKKNKIDILVLAEYTTAPIAYLASLFWQGKIIFCDHGTLSNQLNDKKATIFRKIGTFISNKIVTLTQKNLKDYVQYFKVKKEKLYVIPNWIEDEVFKHKQPYDINSKTIISSGRFSPEKGFDMLSGVAKIIFERHPHWLWKIYGDGPELSKIISETNKLNIDKNVIFKGKVDAMYDKYREGAIFVHLSYREGLSLVLLEAHANNLPIVSFDCVAGPSEIIKDNIDGFLIKCYDKIEMAEKICKLIENPNLRESFSKNSANNLEKFGKNKILKDWEDLFDEF